MAAVAESSSVLVANMSLLGVLLLGLVVHIFHPPEHLLHTVPFELQQSPAPGWFHGEILCPMVANMFSGVTDKYSLPSQDGFQRGRSAHLAGTVVCKLDCEEGRTGVARRFGLQPGR